MSATLQSGDHTHGGFELFHLISERSPHLPLHACDSCFTPTSIALLIHVLSRDRHHLTCRIDREASISGLELVCYREGEGGTVARCIDARQLILSPQTAATGKVEGDINRFRGGVLVLDEAMSFALSVGGDWTDSTINHHQYLASFLRRLVDIMPFVVVMDRDLTLTPHVSKMLAAIAPDRDVIHAQFERAAQSNAFCYAFNHS